MPPVPISDGDMTVLSDPKIKKALDVLISAVERFEASDVNRLEVAGSYFKSQKVIDFSNGITTPFDAHLKSISKAGSLDEFNLRVGNLVDAVGSLSEQLNSTLCKIPYDGTLPGDAGTIFTAKRLVTAAVLARKLYAAGDKDVAFDLIGNATGECAIGAVATYVVSLGIVAIPMAAARPAIAAMVADVWNEFDGYEALQARLEQWGRKSGNCIVAGRMKRSNERKWSQTRSCLGGAPKLSEHDWPRGMNCVAQIDLKEVAAQNSDLNIPKNGNLAFFADTGSFSGFPHLGAVRAIPANSFGVHEIEGDAGTLYGQGWDYYRPSYDARTHSDAPKEFPRWPLVFNSVDQSANVSDSYSPSLDDIFGPEAPSVHLPLEGLVSGVDREGHFYPNEDASPFPALAARMIFNNAIQKFGERNLEKLNATGFEVGPVRSILEKWSSVFETVNLNEPLGSVHGPNFTSDLAAIEAAFSTSIKRIGFGSGTTITGGAALDAYFAMYRGDRDSFEAIPDAIRNYFETQRMRSAFSAGIPMTHQVGGYGANVQESEMAARGMKLLLQLTTDEAVGFMWGDVGVLQYWISPENLAQANWEKVEFLMHGH